MKFSKMKTLVAMLVVFLVSGLSYGQDCANGRCYRSAFRGAAKTVDRAVTATAYTTAAVVEHVGEATGRVVDAAFHAAGDAVHVAARVGSSPVRLVSSGLAQSKAERQAAAGRMYHVGGGFGGGRYEGVGFSTYSADDAVRRCCYWGQRQVLEIGVARGARGWYATVIYN